MIKKTALIIVDMQNAFCSKEGSFWKRGRKILNLDKILKINQKLLSFARDKKWIVIFVKLVYKKDYSNAGLLVKNNPEIIKLKAYQENTWDSEIVDILKPRKNEYIIKKQKHDPFIGTDLLRILQKNKIKRIIISGVATNICVESTIRSAFDNDFETILIKNATSTCSRKLYNASLETINKSFGKVISLNELIKNE